MQQAATKSTTLTQAMLRGLACKCPACGEGKLFDCFLEVAPSCRRCGLDFSFTDAGDGPAVFIILIAGFVVVFIGLIIEVKYDPPYWLDAVVGLPLVLATTLLPLRPMKSLLISLQHHHQASEGRLVDRDMP
jgi:uncharacterized protein (DUF983 family)